MNIDKNTIVELLKNAGRHDDANKASTELPDQVDTEKHAGLLGKFGLDPQEIMAKLGKNPQDLLGEAGKLFGR